MSIFLDKILVSTLNDYNNFHTFDTDRQRDERVREMRDTKTETERDGNCDFESSMRVGGGDGANSPIEQMVGRTEKRIRRCLNAFFLRNESISRLNSFLSTIVINRWNRD